MVIRCSLPTETCSNAIGFYPSLVTVKLIIGINLLSFANRRKDGMEQRAKDDDEINDGAPIGEGKDEKVSCQARSIRQKLITYYGQTYNRELKSLLNQSKDDATMVADMGEGKAEKGGGGKKKRIQLEELTRFTMIKRIW